MECFFGKKIEETKNYIEFENEIKEGVQKWKAARFKIPSNMDRLYDRRSKVILLHGEAGTGKTEYLKILNKRLENAFTFITDLSKIENDGMYIIDAANEIQNYDENKLSAIAKERNAFVIVSSWYKTRIFSSFQIEPSEETLIGTTWEKIGELFKEYDFSIREKTLMSKMKNFNTLFKKQKHEILWKAFEELFDTNNQKDAYKFISNQNPIIANRNISDEIFDFFEKKHIIQWNEKIGEYVFSHSVISSHLFLRKRTEQIKTLIFSEDDIEKIRMSPSSLIWWHKTLIKDDEKLFSFLSKNKIKIRVKDFFNLDIDKKKMNDIEFKKLNFEDLSLLADNICFQRMYDEYLAENLNTSRELSDNDLGKADAAYFMFSILSELAGDDYSPRIINSLKPTFFWKSIVFKNENDRHKMLNFVLAAYIKLYFDETLSPLEISKLENEIFCGHDKKCNISLYEFVSKCKKQVPLKDAIKLDHVLNNGSARTDILDGSRVYREYDKRFKTSRNAIGTNIFDIGHQFVNAYLYKRFEQNTNPVTETDIKSAIKIDLYNEYSDMKYDVSPAFLKFVVLLFKKSVYYFKNMPILNTEFNSKLELPSQDLIKLIIQKDVDKLSEYICSFIKRNDRVCFMKISGDPILTKNGICHFWMYPQNIKHLFDKNLEDSDFVLYEYSLYSKEKLEYNIGPFSEIKISKKRGEQLFEIGIKLDDISNNFENNDFSLLLNTKTGAYEIIQYRDPNEQTVSNDDEIDEMYEKYEDDLLPYIKRGWIK